jgi:multicomponent Na+:H+ antiporter subunit E
MTGRAVAGRFVIGAWLVAVWTLLWGSVTFANVLGGIVVAAVLLVLLPRPTPDDDDGPIIAPLALVGLLGWFVVQLVSATVDVAAEVLRPASRSRIRTAVVRVDLPGAPDGIVTTVANAITLTPGTLTLEVRPEGPSLYVHVMAMDSEDAVRADVLELERRVVAAVGSRAARTALEARS